MCSSFISQHLILGITEWYFSYWRLSFQQQSALTSQRVIWLVRYSAEALRTVVTSSLSAYERAPFAMWRLCHYMGWGLGGGGGWVGVVGEGGWVGAPVDHASWRLLGALPITPAIHASRHAWNKQRANFWSLVVLLEWRWTLNVSMKLSYSFLLTTKSHGAIYVTAPFHCGRFQFDIDLTRFLSFFFR